MLQGTRLHIMCGIPGCGKSTLAAKLNRRLVCTDKIRERIQGDTVFNIAQEAVKSWLNQDEDVVYDATNTTRSARDPLIKTGKRCGAKVIVHRIKCPLEVAIERNEVTDKKVPIAAIMSFYAKFEEPGIEEGMDEILIYDSDLQLQDEIIPDK